MRRKKSPAALVIAGPYLGAKVTLRPNQAMKPPAHQILDSDLKGRWVVLDPSVIREIKRSSVATVPNQPETRG